MNHRPLSIYFKRRFGFTLIELLVVVAIIAVILVVGLVFYDGATKQARVARRAQNLRALSAALDIYKVNNKGKYPAQSGWACADAGLAPLLPNYIASIPKDPKGGCYQYQSTNSDKDFKLRTEPGIADMTTDDYKSVTDLIDPANDGGSDANRLDPGANVAAWAVYSPGARTLN